MGWIGPAIGAATSIGSGIKGKQGAGQAQQRQDQQDALTQEMLGGFQDERTAMQGQANKFLTGGGLSASGLANQAQSGGQNYQNQLWGLMETLQGNTPSMEFGSIPGQGIAGSAASSLSSMGGPTYNFEPGRRIQDQAMQQFDEFSGRQRDTALEQAGQAFTGGNRALSEALAGRGISANSGVAGSALGDLARQGAQSQTDLGRALADQAGQQGLAATQFDISSGLQREGMESNFALGAAGQEASNMQASGQLGLGMGQNMLTGQGQQAQFELGRAGQVAQNAGLAGDLATQSYMNPLQMQQQMFQQNQMQPYLQMMGMTNPQDMLRAAMGMQDSALDRRERQNEGTSFGGLGEAFSELQSAIKSKDKGGMNSGQQGAWNQSLWGGNTGGSNNPY